MKISRKPKKPDPSSKLVLEEIIGLTTKNANGLASSIKNGNCVYMAGYVAVVYNVDSGTQSHLMVSHRMPKPLNCVAVSQDGRFIAAGESGHQPAVLVWDSKTLAFISELKCHQYGVVCIAFSPDGKHLVSVGFPHDGYICLWDWQRGLLVAKLKSSSSCSAIASVSFSSDGKLIITAGKKHLKFWMVGSSTRLRTDTGTGSIAMHGKPINLGYHKGSSFTSVSSPIWASSSLGGKEETCELFPIYALTDVGVLCLLDSGLSVQKSVDLEVEKGFALSTSDKLIACACSNGIVQLFTIETLEYAGSLQYSQSKICEEAKNKICHAEVSKTNCQLGPTLPDAIACQFSTSRKLVVVYGDHSLYIWDIHDVHKASRCCVLVSHSACIWDIKSLSCENMHDPSLACVARGCYGGVSFATCSADGNIRLWDLALQSDISEDTTSKLAVDHCSLITEPVGTTHLVSAGILESENVGSGVGTQGFRSMAVSSDGKYLAAGDCQGNLHIYNLHTSDYTCFQDAHDAEILSLSFNLPSRKDFTSHEIKSHYFLASGGRDRLIHLYDVERNFDLVGSADDHSASVTSVKLTSNGSKILSCSADRSLVFRDVAVMATGCKISRRHHQMASHGTVYDMAVDPKLEVAITVGQDKKINTFNIASGKLIKSLKQDGDLGDPIKVTIDPSCTYLVCSYSNKSICMYDFITGEMVAQEMGHSEVITGVIFLPDCKHIISVGGDSCIFVWKLPTSLSSRMLQRIKESSDPLSPASMLLPLSSSRRILSLEEDYHLCEINPEDKSLPTDFNKVNRSVRQEKNHQETSAFKFSISRLPKWARSKVTSSENAHGDAVVISSEMELKNFSPIVGSCDGHDFVYPEVQTPPKHDMGDKKQCLGTIFSSSSDTDCSGSSSMPPEIHRNFAMDNRWLTIHTVCLDLLNSPEIWDVNDMRTPVSSPHLLQSMAVETPINEEHKEISSRGHTVVNHFSVEHPSSHGNHVVDDGPEATLSGHPQYHAPGSMFENNDQLCVHNASACNYDVVSEVSAQLQSNTTESRVQTNLDFKSQDNDLFNQHFSNLSTVPKTEGRKSSGRRRFSARFVVRQDCIGDCSRLFETYIKDLGSETLNCGEESSLHSIFKNPSIPGLEEPQLIDAFEQDTNNSPQGSLSSSHTESQSECFVQKNSLCMEVREVRDQKECIIKGTEMEEPIIACKKALICLDAAAGSALRLFSNLENLVSREEISSGPEADLYHHAAELLPSIAEKVNAIAKLVQASKNNLCGKTRKEFSTLEPLLGTFAENLS
ncbi:uncharacterized protein LOC100240770 isoform X2 [Vitis vinifera]|nr:uncharacterized protein LOC100240770 isoform X2 [Vitis vinifera]|eukprot:XP_010654199.1 PREDICTED: mitogen-activated protein kinase-binding protein 1 isoform X2 [Vitis vinifera]